MNQLNKISKNHADYEQRIAVFGINYLDRNSLYLRYNSIVPQ